jgi:hypothetical protein
VGFYVAKDGVPGAFKDGRGGISSGLTAETHAAAKAKGKQELLAEFPDYIASREGKLDIHFIKAKCKAKGKAKGKGKDKDNDMDRDRDTQTTLHQQVPPAKRQCTRPASDVGQRQSAALGADAAAEPDRKRQPLGGAEEEERSGGSTEESLEEKSSGDAEVDPDPEHNAETAESSPERQRLGGAEEEERSGDKGKEEGTEEDSSRDAVVGAAPAPKAWGADNPVPNLERRSQFIDGMENSHEERCFIIRTEVMLKNRVNTLTLQHEKLRLAGSPAQLGALRELEHMKTELVRAQTNVARLPRCT